MKKLLEKLNGWQRLGVVLSGAWAVYVLLAMLNDRHHKFSFGEYLLVVVVGTLAGWVVGYAIAWVVCGFREKR